MAILDADKEGFLRSERSLIQTIGRAARNLQGRAILYADRITDSMERAMGETNRRRERQLAHNLEQGITPRSIIKNVRDLIDGVYSEKAGREMERMEQDVAQRAQIEEMSEKDVGREIKRLEKLMMEHARNLAFEQAAQGAADQAASRSGPSPSIGRLPRALAHMGGVIALRGLPPGCRGRLVPQGCREARTAKRQFGRPCRRCSGTM